MYVECTKCGHGFASDILGEVFCPKCGFKNRNDQLTRSQYEKVSKRVEEALVGYVRCTTAMLRRNDKNHFERTLTHIENPKVTIYADSYSKLPVRFDEKRIIFSDYTGAQDKYHTYDVRTVRSKSDSGVSTVGENMIEIKAFDVMDMSNAEIVEYVDKLFKNENWAGVSSDMKVVSFITLWDTLDERLEAVSAITKKLCIEGEISG